MKIPFVEGRDFTERDNLEALPVAIVNVTLARRFFPNENPVGKRIEPSISNGYKDAPLREIVGVVGDVKGRGLANASEPDVYVPEAQSGMSMTVVLRTSGEPLTAINLVREQVRLVDREIPVYDIVALDQYLATAVSQPRFNTVLLGLFAGLAMLLTTIGLSGVISYSAIQRTHEICIRRALCAARRDVLRLALG